MKRLLPFISAVLLALPSGAESIVRDGDHIAIVGNTFADQLRVHGYLETLLQQHADISLRNLGWAGDTLTQRDRPTNFPAEEQTLTEQRTDVIIACFGMGESFGGEQGIPAFKKDLQAFVDSHEDKKYNGESPPRLVLVSPIAYEYHGAITPDLVGRNTALEAYTAAMKETADQEGIAFIDLFGPTRAMMEAAEGAKLTSNGIHLNPLGYWAVSRILASRLVDGSGGPWALTIDAKGKSAEGGSLEVSGIEAEGRNLSFSATETKAAGPPPPTALKMPSGFSAERDRLVVKNLEPGEYTLTIDGVKIATADHAEWSKGVIIDSSPAHQEAEEMRALVKDKNLQFLYNWKALNQVHIVGERKRSPSGRSLPKEQARFNELAKEQERALRQTRVPAKREWKLVFQGL